MLALRKAAWERQREESLMQQRWKLAAALPTVTDPEAAAAQLAKPLSTRFAGPPHPLFKPTPAPRSCQAASAVRLEWAVPALCWNP